MLVFNKRIFTSSCSGDTGIEIVFRLRFLIFSDFLLPSFVACITLSFFLATLCFPLSVNISH